MRYKQIINEQDLIKVGRIRINTKGTWDYSHEMDKWFSEAHKNNPDLHGLRGLLDVKGNILGVGLPTPLRSSEASLIFKKYIGQGIGALLDLQTDLIEASLDELAARLR